MASQVGMEMCTKETRLLGLELAFGNLFFSSAIRAQVRSPAVYMGVPR